LNIPLGSPDGVQNVEHPLMLRITIVKACSVASFGSTNIFTASERPTLRMSLRFTPPQMFVMNFLAIA
jgi:hypothetical protein